jgi:hypothetical protein
MSGSQASSFVYQGAVNEVVNMEVVGIVSAFGRMQ